MASKFELLKNYNQEYYFHLKAANGEIILRSEMYSAKQGANNGIDSVKTHAPFDIYYDRLQSRNSEYYFNLKAVNGQIIGTSQMYSSSYARDNGIESVKTNAPTASVYDLT